MTDPTLHALVVEDDHKLARIFARAVQNAGFTVATIGDGRDAINHLQHHTPDLVLLDMHLPHFSGKEILHAIRADARLAAIRVILATADAVMADSLRDEADLVLLKPVSFHQLSEMSDRMRRLCLQS